MTNVTCNSGDIQGLDLFIGNAEHICGSLVKGPVRGIKGTSSMVTTVKPARQVVPVSPLGTIVVV